MNPDEILKRHGNSTFSQIPEEDEGNASPAFHPSIKTQNFEDPKYKEMFKRRSNTSSDNIDKEVEEVAESYESMINSKIRDPAIKANIDEVDAKLSLEYLNGEDTAVPSDINTSSVNQKSSSQVTETKKTPKESSVGSKIALILVIMVILSSVYLIDFDKLDKYSWNEYFRMASNSSQKPKKTTKGTKVNKPAKVKVLRPDV